MAIVTNCTKQECPGVLEFTEVQKAMIVDCPDRPINDIFFVGIDPNFNWNCPLIQANRPPMLSQIIVPHDNP